MFFTPLEPLGTEEEEEYCDFARPRKVQYKTGWMHSVFGKQNRMQYHGTVPPDFFERVITQHGEMTIYQRSSTPSLAPRIVLKSAWNEQQQQQQRQDVLSQGAAGNCWQDRVQNLITALF